MLKYNVPLYVDDTKDQARCVQACFKMILKYFLPKRDFNWRTLDKFTHKIRGKGTWWFPIYPTLSHLGFDIKEFDDPLYYQNLAKYGVKYLYKVHKKIVADWYIKHSNIKEVIKLIPQFLDKTTFCKKSATLKDIEKLLVKGYLLLVDINFCTIYRKSGFASHAVIITGFNRQNFYINDPANRQGKDLPVNKKLFQKAWHSLSLAAFKLKSKSLSNY